MAHTHLKLFLFSLIFLSLHATAQLPPKPVEGLVQTFLTLSNDERIAFLQEIALLSLQSAVQLKAQDDPAAVPRHAEIPVIEPEIHPALVKAIEPTPEPLADSTHEANQNPTSETLSKNLLQVTLIPSMTYSFSDNHQDTFNIFTPLSNEYNRRFGDQSKRINEDDIKNEALKFFVTEIEQQLDRCGYQIVLQSDIEQNPLHDLLQTGINRIVINKTLFETSVIGEGFARIETVRPSEKPVIQSLINVRAVQNISDTVDKKQQYEEIKYALDALISKLSVQITKQLCQIKP